jgi:prepilin-type N-terminal cleavage/methylation domain-containing protein
MTLRVRSRSQAGFTLIELLLALIVAVEILIAAYMAFDVSNKTAAIQTQVTDLQQSLRIVQHDMLRLARMAGRGGLLAELRPDHLFDDSVPVPLLQGLALEVRNNVTDATDRNIARGDGDSPVAFPGTDILILRGCFSTPLFQVQQESLALVDTSGDGNPDEGTMPIQDIGAMNIRQPLGPLCDELRDRGTATLILGSAVGRDTWGIADVTGHDCPASGEPSTVNLELNVATSSTLNPDLNTDPDAVNRQFPPTLDAVSACVLEEYRYYVREQYVDDSAPTPETLRPVLMRARFEPGTELPYAGDAQNFALPLADGIIDLQIALGFDSDFPSPNSTTPGAVDDDDNFDNSLNDEVVFEAPDWDDRELDDWLFNHPDDDADDDGVVAETRWRRRSFEGRVGQAVPLRQLRITTVARTNRGDPSYVAPDFDPAAGRDFVEDHDYDQTPASDFKNEINRKYRRRSLTTVVSTRNL